MAACRAREPITRANYELIAFLERNYSKVFKCDKLLGWRNDVWNELAATAVKELAYTSSGVALHKFAQRNITPRSNQSDTSENESEQNEKSVEISRLEKTLLETPEKSIENVMKVTVVIGPDVWDAIKPDKYDILDFDTLHKTKYFVYLQKDKWSGEIRNALQKHKNVKCAIAINHHRLCVTGAVFLSIRAYCKGCKENHRQDLKKELEKVP